MKNNTIDWKKPLKTPQGLNVELLKVKRKSDYNYQILTGTKRKTLCHVNKHGIDERGTKKVAFNAFDKALIKKTKPVKKPAAEVASLDQARFNHINRMIADLARKQDEILQHLQKELSRIDNVLCDSVDFPSFNSFTQWSEEKIKLLDNKIRRFETTPIAQIKRPPMQEAFDAAKHR